MELLERRIRQDGTVLPGNILKVDSFLNHQLDTALLDALGAELARRYAGAGVTKVLTVEASGIAVACFAARHLGVPALFAKKAKSHNLNGAVLVARVHSYTYGRDYEITVAARFLGPDDRVLIVDDFLANGQAAQGLLAICRQAGAAVAGFGICIEKGFQPGGGALRAAGVRVESLAIIDRMDENGIVFRKA